MRTDDRADCAATGFMTKAREAQDLRRALNMSAFVALGILRHWQGMSVLREQVQTLRHRDPSDAAHVPLVRSTCSEARPRSRREAYLGSTMITEETCVDTFNTVSSNRLLLDPITASDDRCC